MTKDELSAWIARRAELFPGLRIPAFAEAAIVHDTTPLEFDTAMVALEAYSREKPFRGFYLDGWMRHYAAAKAHRARTDSGRAAAAAAAREKDEDERALDDQRREWREYRALPADVIDRATKALHDIGYPPDETNRAWRFIVLAWHRGEDVERYRVHRDTFGKTISGSIRTIADQLADLREARSSIDRQIEWLTSMKAAV
jgi:hypothetical protein